MLVEIWSDIACPWCYVGRARFAAALAAFEHRDEVTVMWRSFELDPDAPAEREGSHAELIARKYGRTLEEVAAMDAALTATAAADGLTIRFAEMRSGNTFDGHRLIHLAAAHGKQDAMKERLFRAYFGEGALISDHATLQTLAVEVGLPADEVRELLLTERYGEEVRDDERTAQSAGISAVPCFVIDRKYGASGAQPPETLLEFLQHGWAQREPAPAPTA
ncbi:DsbA family oxidoreductase [Baekduia sp.]|jgi:predicted DsbA family dithiol-disulfide isomerase|uniref:DsbA family oxidoreductase n=1 Tax=Baekduia sp. TaxID=2600305 RepID=UPI002DFAE17C|nr:DsbA family oxidoreductase [Baekduia sp.]